MPVKKSELYSILWEACNKLRGGVEPSRYKDYVLILLFFKYVSDKYKGEKYATFTVTDEVSFDHLIELKGKVNIGEEVDKIIRDFIEKNELVGLLPDVSFNNQAELGEGKELVDKLTGLIAIFENPALDFKSNRASGDDIIGDAYEFFMMKFAQESGKSKGQFYTPSEVSRVLAKLIGINQIKHEVGKVWELYDPACGSGSLLIRAADEAPKKENGESLVSIYGQEKYQDTAALAKMNFILHNKSTGEVHSGNTLSNPRTNNSGNLRTFDFAVMNPPFSDKDWSDGLNIENDPYNRFTGYGTPPTKNGDYAWFLHILKSLNANGKAGIILPHGVLFRGNSEETIRKQIIDKRYIKGIVGLPANLFYGTGIPAAIILVDKENSEEREGIFFIDASRGFKKDGNKNRLREQDIEKIVQTYTQQLEIPGYSRFVSYDEITDIHQYNLNIPRYIQSIDNSLSQSIQHHLNGGIPEKDVDSLEMLWSISSDLKDKIYEKKQNAYYLSSSVDLLEETIKNDSKVVAEIEQEKLLYQEWKGEVRNILHSIDSSTQPKDLIQDISLQLLNKFKSAKLLDQYFVYDCLLNYWNDVMQDDVYILKAAGYEAAKEVEIEYKVSKGKETKTINNYEGLLIPTSIIEKEYFETEIVKIQKLQNQVDVLESQMKILVEENSEEDGLLVDVLNSKGDGIHKDSLKNRIKELDSLKESKLVTVLEKILLLVNQQKTSEIEKFFKKNTELKQLDLRNKNNTVGKSKVNIAIKDAKESANVPQKYKEEYDLLQLCQSKIAEKEQLDKQMKKERLALDEKVRTKYEELTTEEIKYLLTDKKWFEAIDTQITEAMEQVLNELANKVILIANRYKTTLKELEDNVYESRDKVKSALERMGYTW